ncbi:MAG: DNA mismatch repair endonuclease MutL [Myxococcales bacterium]|nr:DNA mismatch repair endonuclease MutL [Myxococcales bacterium]
MRTAGRRRLAGRPGWGRRVSAPPPRIALLDPLVVSQIAAGEVVERPASVVKELVENALDAGATHVRVALWEGGRARIQVTDNGTGMDADDARLAFARHATSKLRHADDLLAIGSFGFRGEALASIVAVADVTMTTRRADMPVGVRLQGAGTTELTLVPCGGPVGTDVVVADLFFNVPARLKFLRTAATELGHVLKFLDALALARPALHLTLHHNDRRILDYPSDPDLRRRAHAVLGADVAVALHPFAAEGDYAVAGLLSEPALSHAGPSQLTLLVNGRLVTDRTLHHAIAHAYGTLLERGRYPVGVLALDCPPGALDVNVHPQKTEVRFASSQSVHSAVGRAVGAMLARTPWVREALAGTGDAEVAENTAGADGALVTDSVADIGTSAADGFPARRSAGAHAAARSPAWARPGAVFGRAADPARGWPAERESPAGAVAVGDGAAAEDEGGAGAGPAQSGLPLDAPTGPWSALRYVGQVGHCFLVCETADALVLIDQHAAHERVLFERFVVGLRGGAVPSQQLLIPLLVPLAPAEVAAVAEAADELARLGIEAEAWGERAVRVRAWPTVLRGRDPAAEVRRLAAALLDGGRGQATVERIERAAATLACHAALRAGDSITETDVRDLLRAMDGVDLAAYCPHGRPVVLKARFDEVGRWFHRS